VPGLGQIYQGRVGKGILFMVCLYGLFFTGLAMGDWQNVYLVDTRQQVVVMRWEMPRLVANLYNRLHFVGQFWMGVAAWPAIWQYNNLPTPSEQASPFWHNFQKGPETPQDFERLNQRITDSDKTPDLAWVYTVIAGVLNILVIYDAIAGPAFGASVPRSGEAAPSSQEPTAKQEAAVP